MKKKTSSGRVSWASESRLCQVKMFLTEDCPAKVSSSNLLPPGFEATTLFPSTRNNIPRIKWKRPPQFIISDALLVGSGGDSTETLSENLRISKVLEAFYPHRSVIPTRPSVSSSVSEAHYDDSTTPSIPLAFIEDEPEPPLQSSHHDFNSVSLLGPQLSLAASAALSSLTKEQGSQVDAHLLVKLLSDPILVRNLLNGNGKPLETANHVTTLNTDFAKPTTHAMDSNPPPLHNVPVSSVQSCATDPPLPKPTLPMSTTLSMKPSLVVHTYPLSSGIKPLPKLEDSYTPAPLKPSPVDNALVSEQNTQPLNMSSTWDMNRVPESAQTETAPQISNGNTNRDDYYKSLIREHGVVSPATNENNNYKGRVDDNKKVVKVKKIQKPCMFFNRPKGCRMGDSCMYLHERSKRSWTDVAPHFPRAKRLKFGS
ncbi:PREDICTED: zinc finger CCCH domain-containing protein 68-like [Camelina sativa]|uniref:Zinc finger CCCH domain-containing protein 68-like n=1 Tax=Camelina sativa TaxID=90675 RepID=A0ABM0W4W3_CAMSA|nr:PREDICTED: zinc finger CCCH domain-containing protein 68-like [Camelina sativa]